MPLSDWTTSYTSSQSPYSPPSKHQLCPPHMLSPPDGASWWGIISERFTSELWGTSLSILSSSYGCHSPGTSSTRLLFQYFTFWYHHFFHVVPPVWKMLTALYIVDLLISAFSLCSFRPSTLSIKCLQFVIHSVVSVFLPGLWPIYLQYLFNKYK